MERAKKVLTLREEESERVSSLAVNPHKPHIEQSFYEDFSLRGIQVDRVEPGLVVCSYKVPPRLADRSGDLAPGAIANLIDEIGAVVIHVEGQAMSVSVNISVSIISMAKVMSVSVNIKNPVCTCTVQV